VEFEVQKHLKPFAMQGLNHRRATAGKDFLAHLHTHLGRIQLVRHSQGLSLIGVIQSDNNRAGDGHGGFLSGG